MRARAVPAQKCEKCPVAGQKYLSENRHEFGLALPNRIGGPDFSQTSNPPRRRFGTADASSPGMAAAASINTATGSTGTASSATGSAGSSATGIDPTTGLPFFRGAAAPGFSSPGQANFRARWQAALESLNPAQQAQNQAAQNQAVESQAKASQGEASQAPASQAALRNTARQQAPNQAPNAADPGAPHLAPRIASLSVPPAVPPASLGSSPAAATGAAAALAARPAPPAGPPIPAGPDSGAASGRATLSFDSRKAELGSAAARRRRAEASSHPSPPAARAAATAPSPGAIPLPVLAPVPLAPPPPPPKPSLPEALAAHGQPMAAALANRGILLRPARPVSGSASGFASGSASGLVQASAPDSAEAATGGSKNSPESNLDSSLGGNLDSGTLDSGAALTDAGVPAASANPLAAAGALPLAGPESVAAARLAAEGRAAMGPAKAAERLRSLSPVSSAPGSAAGSAPGSAQHGPGQSAPGDAAAPTMPHGPDHAPDHAPDHGLARDMAPAASGIEARSAGSPASAVSGGGNPFTALDAGSGAGSSNATWTHAGARQAEAGFNDPELGWVGVRADLAGGSVHASVLSGSAEASQSLGGHLAGLSAHLAENHIPVESVSIARQDAGAAAGGFQQGTAQQQGQGSGGQSSEGEPGAPRNAFSYAAGSPARVSSLGTGSGPGSGLGPGLGTGLASGSIAAGRHISVMA